MQAKMKEVEAKIVQLEKKRDEVRMIEWSRQVLCKTVCCKNETELCFSNLWLILCVSCTPVAVAAVVVLPTASEELNNKSVLFTVFPKCKRSQAVRFPWH